MWRCKDGVRTYDGDYFPDQVGPGYSVVYAHDIEPVWVNTVFAVCYNEKNREYYVAEQTELWCSVDLCGYEHNGPTELDPLAYQDFYEARTSAQGLAWQYADHVWQDEDLWDGTAENFPTEIL